MKLKLSVLDQTPVRAGSTAAVALQESVQLARFTDTLGYTRYWVSEHHNILTLACAAPEVLISRLAAETKHLRFGSGGIMLPNHSSLKVAENFRLLEALYPGRIDLGIGRAPGGDFQRRGRSGNGHGSLRQSHRVESFGAGEVINSRLRKRSQAKLADAFDLRGAWLHA